LLRSAEHPISSVGDDLEQLNALLSGDDPAQGFYGGFGGGPHRPRGASSASGSVTDDLEQLNALLTADDPPVKPFRFLQIPKSLVGKTYKDQTSNLPTFPPKWIDRQSLVRYIAKQ